MSDGASYDIAVSFAEEQRSYVVDVVEACRQRGMTVLYGPEHVHDWWARKGEGDLPDARVRFFVPFVSTVEEFVAAMLRAVKAGDAHVLPVLVGDVAVPADLLHPQVSYLRGVEYQADQLAAALAGRVERAEETDQKWARLAAVVIQARETRAPTAVPVSFSRYAEQDAALRYLGEQFAAAAPGLARRGFVGSVHRGDSRVAVRIERAGDTVYALDIQRGGIGGDDTVNFVLGRHDPGSVCSNGWARPVYDVQAGAPKLELHDLSVLGGSNGESRTYTKEELFTALWQRVDAGLSVTVG